MKAWKYIVDSITHRVWPEHDYFWGNKTILLSLRLTEVSACSLSQSLSLLLFLSLSLYIYISLPLLTRAEIQTWAFFPAVKYCWACTYFIKKSEEEQTVVLAMNQTVEIHALSTLSARTGKKQQGKAKWRVGKKNKQKNVCRLLEG